MRHMRRDGQRLEFVGGLLATPLMAPPADRITLRPGDIVPLEHPVTRPLTVMSAGVTFAYAVAGSSGRRLACLVVPPPQEESR